MSRSCSTSGENRSAYRFWWESQKERPKRRWVNNIKMDFRETGGGGMDWIDRAQDRDNWNTVMNFRVP
jgi:hypothetical protein